MFRAWLVHYALLARPVQASETFVNVRNGTGTLSICEHIYGLGTSSLLTGG